MGWAILITASILWYFMGIITGWCSIDWLKARYMRKWEKERLCALCEEEEREQNSVDRGSDSAGPTSAYYS